MDTCECGHARSRHEFYTNTLHGCKDCGGYRGRCSYFRPKIAAKPRRLT